MTIHRPIWQSLVCFFLTILVTGCATTKPTATITTENRATGVSSTSGARAALATNLPTSPVQTEPAKNHEMALKTIENWHINGKVAVQTAKNAGSASVDWVQHQRHYMISLVGPLGSHRLLIQGQPGNVNMSTAEGKHFSATSPEQLLAKQWGFRLPISNLHYWIRGMAVPGIPSKSQYDNGQHLKRLIQQNWDVQYLSYMRKGNLDLPQRIFITSPALRVKIIVYQWQI